jgi:hypothetical protein
MKAQDLTFHDIEGAPPNVRCNRCGALGVRRAAEVPLPDQSGDVAMVGMCSPACESVFKRNPDSDQAVSRILSMAGAVKKLLVAESAGQDEEWPEEL